jgi:hypothetical protein
MQGKPTRPVPSRDEIAAISLAISKATEPVELVGMKLAREEECELSDCEAWRLTVLAREARSLGDALNEHATAIEGQVERLAIDLNWKEPA